MVYGRLLLGHEPTVKLSTTPFYAEEFSPPFEFCAGDAGWELRQRGGGGGGGGGESGVRNQAA
eukprot:1079863-Prorocentrum_minimum.AAC.1